MPGLVLASQLHLRKPRFAARAGVQWLRFSVVAGLGLRRRVEYTGCRLQTQCFGQSGSCIYIHTHATLTISSCCSTSSWWRGFLGLVREVRMSSTRYVWGTFVPRCSQFWSLRKAAPFERDKQPPPRRRRVKQRPRLRFTSLAICACPARRAGGSRVCEPVRPRFLLRALGSRAVPFARPCFRRCWLPRGGAAHASHARQVAPSGCCVADGAQVSSADIASAACTPCTCVAGNFGSQACSPPFAAVPGAQVSASCTPCMCVAEDFGSQACNACSSEAPGAQISSCTPCACVAADLGSQACHALPAVCAAVAACRPPVAEVLGAQVSGTVGVSASCSLCMRVAGNAGSQACSASSAKVPGAQVSASCALCTCVAEDLDSQACSAFSSEFAGGQVSASCTPRMGVAEYLGCQACNALSAEVLGAQPVLAHSEVTRVAFDEPDPLRGGGQAAGSAVRRRRRKEKDTIQSLVASVRQLKSALADLQATVLQLRGTPGALQAPSSRQAPLKRPEVGQGSANGPARAVGVAQKPSQACLSPTTGQTPPRGSPKAAQTAEVGCR